MTIPTDKLTTVKEQPPRTNGSAVISVETLEKMGLNVTDDVRARAIVPYHITSVTDIFCNRELNMQTITAIGFDMDYTLAQYKKEFDLLAYNGAKEKLLSFLHYPDEVNSLQYEDNICRRGCIIDRKRGNILKLDQHLYPRAVAHGLTLMDTEQRKEAYRASFQEAETFNTPDFINIDTPFSLVDACLFAQLVDLRDRMSEDPNAATANFWAGKSYGNLWSDMRKCVDRCHKDGVIKLKVAEDPQKYIIQDKKLFKMLKKFRDSGKKVFLLTNSLFDYTHVVMNYLHGAKSGDKKDLQWAEYFDVIFVGGNKPAFLLNDRNLSPYRVNPVDNSLQHLDYIPEHPAEVEKFLAKGKFFQGGNFRHLHNLLGDIQSGDNVLYVGDHMFADILRTKRSVGWRTCLIVPELPKEIVTHKKLREQRKEVIKLRRMQSILEQRIDALCVKRGVMQREGAFIATDSAREQLTQRLAALEADINTLETGIVQLKDVTKRKNIAFDSAFHPMWGQLFKAGFQESRISKQIRDYACIFTSKPSNLGQISPLRPLRPTRDKMPHDFLTERIW